MASRTHRKNRKSRSTRRRYKGGFVFTPATYDPSKSNPYTTYDINKHDIDLRPGINTRNLVGGKRRNKRRSRKTKGGTTLNFALIENEYGNHNPKLV
jgi:hypothetical protein